ncbi:MAG: chemotaxis protein CheW [Desulfobacterales bacterium]
MADYENMDMVEEVEAEDTQEGKFLTFPLGNEEYGIEIRNVTEIIGIQSITDLPDTPAFVKGVINLRGKVIPVIDVRLRFNIEEKQYNDRTCIIVVSINNISVGLIVDTVSEVIDIPASNIEPPPKVNNKAGNRFIEGLGKVDEDVKILLDTQKLLFNDELEQISESLTA